MSGVRGRVGKGKTKGEREQGRREEGKEAFHSAERERGRPFSKWQRPGEGQPLRFTRLVIIVNVVFIYL